MSRACVFCAVVAGTEPAHVVVSTPDAVAFLDHRPLFEGHVLVVPRRHVPTLRELPSSQVGPFFGLVQQVESAVRDALRAPGSFVAANNVVSQSVAHLHVHVVPRRPGDGLRGFFWPRTRYPDDAAAARVAALVREALAMGGLV